MDSVTERTQAIVPTAGLDVLIQTLTRRGYDVIGPVARDGAIVYDQIKRVEDLPLGWTDEQETGWYRLKPSPSAGFFAYAAGPQSWKKYLHPAEVRLWSAERTDGVFRILGQPEVPNRRYAFIGVRACELVAIRKQDRVLLENGYRDPIYGSRKLGLFVVAVQCTHAAATCFCASLGTGPKPVFGFDLALTEVPDGFLMNVGSEAGAAVLAELAARAELGVRDAGPDALQQAQAAVEEVTNQQIRRLNVDGIKELLDQNFEHPRWEQTAARCLACGNCTMVCPTCFCTSVEDASDLAGDHAERWRRWDSCFTTNFSYIHGGSVRASIKARYRQWLTHKLAAWIDQFGSLGCVGCGRCIAWCPAGIDLTQEIRAMRET